MTQVISQRETLPCVMVPTKYKKKTGNWGPGPWNSETVELRNYSEIVACYSPLLVLVCWSVSQDPPGRLKTLLLRRPFYTLRRQRSANQRSRMCTWHLADQSAIASRQTPLFSERQAIYRSPCVNIC